MVVAREEAEEHIQGPKDLTETPTGFAKKKALTTSWFYRRGDVLTIHSCFLVVFFMFFSFPPHNVGKTKKHQLRFVKNRLSSLFFPTRGWCWLQCTGKCGYAKLVLGWMAEDGGHHQKLIKESNKKKAAYILYTAAKSIHLKYIYIYIYSPATCDKGDSKHMFQTIIHPELPRVICCKNSSSKTFVNLQDSSFINFIKYQLKEK